MMIIVKKVINNNNNNNNYIIIIIFIYYQQAVIQNVSFHPNGQVLMTSGFDKTLRLFQVSKLNIKMNIN